MHDVHSNVFIKPTFNAPPLIHQVTLPEDGTDDR